MKKNDYDNINDSLSDFRLSDWDAMEKLLDKNSKKKAFPWFWILGLSVICISIVLLGQLFLGQNAIFNKVNTVISSGSNTTELATPFVQTLSNENNQTQLSSSKKPELLLNDRSEEKKHIVEKNKQKMVGINQAPNKVNLTKPSNDKEVNASNFVHQSQRNEPTTSTKTSLPLDNPEVISLGDPKISDPSLSTLPIPTTKVEILTPIEILQPDLILFPVLKLNLSSFFKPLASTPKIKPTLQKWNWGAQINLIAQSKNNALHFSPQIGIPVWYRSTPQLSFLSGVNYRLVVDRYSSNPLGQSRLTLDANGSWNSSIISSLNANDTVSYPEPKSTVSHIITIPTLIGWQKNKHQFYIGLDHSFLLYKSTIFKNVIRENGKAFLDKASYDLVECQKLNLCPTPTYKLSALLYYRYDILQKFSLQSSLERPLYGTSMISNKMALGLGFTYNFN
jgi:hypothetical protein